MGKDWRPGGSLLIGVNPGGGTDAYRRNPTDDVLYAALRHFRLAEGADEQAAAFRALTETWIQSERTHAIRLLVGTLLGALGTDDSHVAFMNLIPFRTRENKVPRVDAVRRAWTLAARPQIEALRPARGFALGNKVYLALRRFEHPSYDVIALPRTNGDRYISSRAKDVIAHLRSSASVEVRNPDTAP